MTTVAIIGGGAAGMAAARHLIKHGTAVTAFESAAMLGGNCLGVDVPLPGGGVLGLDAGVSDFDVDTFVRFKAALDELGVAYAPIGRDASFMTLDGDARIVVRDGRMHGLDGSVARLSEIARFDAECVEVLGSELFADWTLERYLRSRNFGEDLERLYVVPRAIGCFSMPNTDPRQFSIQSLVRLWNMHRLVGGRGTPRRMAVVGGMHTYCAAMHRWLVRQGAIVHCSTRVTGVARGSQFVEVRAMTTDDDRLVDRFDHVVFATPPRLAASILDDPTALELAALTQLQHQRARLLVHTDARLMPRERDAWGAYNYLTPDGDALKVHPTITFFPKLLVGLPEDHPDVFVSLNPPIEPRPELVIAERHFEHPVATCSTYSLTAQVDRLQGQHNTWYCGSHLCEPFLHEQAYATGEEAAWRILRHLCPPHHGRATPLRSSVSPISAQGIERSSRAPR